MGYSPLYISIHCDNIDLDFVAINETKKEIPNDSVANKRGRVLFARSCLPCFNRSRHSTPASRQ